MLRSIAPMFPLASGLLLGAACAWALVAVASRRRRPRMHRVAAAAAAISGVGSLLMAVAFVAAGGRAADEPERTRLVPVPGVRASTDRGTDVPLGWPADNAVEEEMPEGFEWRAIAATAGRSQANCHGWVFAEGEYWIPTDFVDTILRDNGYEWIAAPVPGDLIIYRDEHARPIHSGLVKAIGEEGFVLVESKWGLLDVFWHTPDDQAFGDDFEYWHSPRPGHTLRLNHSSPAAKRVDASGKGR